MDRSTDLTIAALLARYDTPSEALREDWRRYLHENEDAFEKVLDHQRKQIHFVGGLQITTRNATREVEQNFLADGNTFGQPGHEPEDDPNHPMWEQFDVWQKVFGEPHPRHVEIDPYSFMWGNETDCDRCGCYMTPLNRPDPCYGICSRCEDEMAEDRETQLF